LWKEVISTGRDLDVACINAGVGVDGLFAETELEKEFAMVNLNCTGTVHLAKYVVQHMTATNSGRILFTASIAGEMVAPRDAVYAATKAFDLSLAHSIRHELRDTAVTVTALQPGPTDTDFFHRAESIGQRWITRKSDRKERRKVARPKWPNKASKRCSTAGTTFMRHR
jgi:short-subunit dehydrogenase